MRLAEAKARAITNVSARTASPIQMITDPTPRKKNGMRTVNETSERRKPGRM
jgi:hypothetical protein